MDEGTTSLKGYFVNFFKKADFVITFGLFAIVFLLILPVPTGLLDILLALNISCSLLIMLTVLYIKNPPEFSVFPTVLLVTTLFRLGLNVASTRLILLEGFAGDVINTFGDVVVQGNYVVGIVVFLILVIINFMVITKGSGRIAEVAARFTLDAMPGKQMSIDAELNAGTITEQEANARRLRVQGEADFYGAMDGASKFVRGDAIAGILITLINVVGGILIGVLQKGLALDQALQKYTILSIGDGLVSQIPSLIISVGAGILITRSTEETGMSASLGSQLLSSRQALINLSVMMGLFAVLPGMPMLPFFLLCVGSAFLAWRHKKKEEAAEEEAQALPGEAGAAGAPAGAKAGTPGSEGQAPSQQEAKDDFANVVHVDAFGLELGYGLLTLADKKKEGDIIERITGVRKTFAREMGIIIPPIAIRDNLELETNDYRLMLRNKEVARSTVIPNRWLAMNVAGSTQRLKGIQTIEPVFGLEAYWIQESEKKNAEVYDFTVVDPTSVLITHLSETIRDHAAALLEREDVQRLVDMVREKNPTLVSELLPDLVNIGLIQRVLQNLLREKVPIKNFTLILETIADYAPVTKNPDELAEQVRRRIGMYFVHEYEAESNVIQAMTLEPRLEQILVGRVNKTQFEVGLMMDPTLAQHLIQDLQIRNEQILAEGLTPVVVTTAELRLAFKRFFEPSFPRMSVLSYQEIPNETQVQSVGVLSMPAGYEAQLQAAEQKAAVR